MKWRRIGPLDFHYITATLTRIWLGHTNNNARSKDHLESRIDAMLEEGDGIVLHEESDPNHIMAWALFRRLGAGTIMLHGVYVRNQYRKMGLATKILELLAASKVKNIGYDLNLVNQDWLIPVAKRLFVSVYDLTDRWVPDR